MKPQDLFSVLSVNDVYGLFYTLFYIITQYPHQEQYNQLLVLGSNLHKVKTEQSIPGLELRTDSSGLQDLSQRRWFVETLKPGALTNGTRQQSFRRADGECITWWVQRRQMFSPRAAMFSHHFMWSWRWVLIWSLLRACDLFTPSLLHSSMPTFIQQGSIFWVSGTICNQQHENTFIIYMRCAWFWIPE